MKGLRKVWRERTEKKAGEKTLKAGQWKILGSKERLCYGLLAAALSGGAGWLFYKSLWGMLACQVLPFVFWGEYKKEVISARRQKLLFGFQDALYTMSASVCAGRSLERAVGDSADNLERMYGKQAWVSREFRELDQRIRNANQPAEQALMELGIRSGLEDIRNFAQICGICVRTGGNLQEAISRAASVITEKISFQRQLHTMTAQKKMEVKILVAIPFLVLCFLQAASPQYSSALYETWAGRLIMTGCLFSIAFAYYWGRQMTGFGR